MTIKPGHLPKCGGRRNGSLLDLKQRQLMVSRLRGETTWQLTQQVDMLMSLAKAIAQAGGVPDDFLHEEFTLGQMVEWLAQNNIRFHYIGDLHEQ